MMVISPARLWTFARVTPCDRLFCPHATPQLKAPKILGKSLLHTLECTHATGVCCRGMSEPQWEGSAQQGGKQTALPSHDGAFCCVQLWDWLAPAAQIGHKIISWFNNNLYLFLYLLIFQPPVAATCAPLTTISIVNEYKLLKTFLLVLDFFLHLPQSSCCKFFHWLARLITHICLSGSVGLSDASMQTRVYNELNTNSMSESAVQAKRTRVSGKRATQETPPNAAKCK